MIKHIRIGKKGDSNVLMVSKVVKKVLQDIRILLVENGRICINNENSKRITV